MKNIHFLLSSIKNGLERQKLVTYAPYSKFNIRILELLFKEGFIIGYVRDINQPGILIIKLRFTLNNYFKDLKTYSIKSTQRHLSVLELRSLANKVKYGVVTTTSGLISIQEAKELKLGGQVIFTF